MPPACPLERETGIRRRQSTRDAPWLGAQKGIAAQKPHSFSIFQGARNNRYSSDLLYEELGKGLEARFPISQIDVGGKMLSDLSLYELGSQFNTTHRKATNPWIQVGALVVLEMVTKKKRLPLAR